MLLTVLAVLALAACICYVIVIRPAEVYRKAIGDMNAGKYAEAASGFALIKEYKDAASLAQKAYYHQGTALKQSGDYTGALTAFRSARSCSDAAAQVLDLSILCIVAANAGDMVTFGSYEQDGNTGNGTEPIEWIVLEADRKTATLISRYALECQKYNREREDVTWETCTLRTWLNETFLQAAFSEEEQKSLQTVTVCADGNPEYNTDPGGATPDRVYLLSIAEAGKYFGSDRARICGATVWARSRGAETNSLSACRWWLRSPGYHSYDAAYADHTGYVNYDAQAVDSSASLYAVRPVIVIGLSD